VKIFCLALGLLGAATIGLAQDLPRFGSLKVLTNKEAVVQLSGLNTINYRIDVSSNLFDWQALATLRSSGTTNQYTDSFAPYLSSRIYRAATLEGTNILTGDHLSTPLGPITMHPINHAALVLGWNGLTIYCDPTGSATLYKNIDRADLILVTHSHGDHFSTSTIDSVKKTNVVIMGPQAVFSGLTAAQKTVAKILTNKATATFGDITIEAVPAYNLTNSNHPKGVGNGYILTIAGRRIYISGDTEDIPETRALTNIDVAFLCMDFQYTMSGPKAVSTVRQFRPMVVYPYHYRNSNGTYTDLNAFKSQVGTDLGIEVRLRPWY
jgi:L-ascorbate metabolism protein UlaG (beta-lactamase superfamily)